jgi:hypothetical protein
MWLAFKRVGPPAFLLVLPIVVLVYAAVVSVHAGNLALDFRGELYPEAKRVLHGANPFPPPNADLSLGVNQIFPIPAAVLAIPLTALPVGAASAVWVAILLLLLGLALWLMEVRDWRVYGLVAFWPATIAALQSGNLSIVLTLLAAAAWRTRDREYAPGVAIGVAVALKLVLWPLAFWLLAVRKFRAAAVAAAISVASVLLVLPFTSIRDYVKLLHNLGDTFGPHSYNLVGLLVQTDTAGVHTAEIVSYLVGATVLAIAVVRRSFPIAVAASLLLSPIVWVHYFVLLAVPLAAAWRRLSLAWFVPLVLWFCPGTTGDVRVRHIVIGLLTLIAVTALAERRRERIRSGRPVEGASRASGETAPGAVG